MLNHLVLLLFEFSSDLQGKYWDSRSILLCCRSQLLSMVFLNYSKWVCFMKTIQLEVDDLLYLPIPR